MSVEIAEKWNGEHEGSSIKKSHMLHSNNNKKKDSNKTIKSVSMSSKAKEDKGKSKQSLNLSDHFYIPFLEFSSTPHCKKTTEAVTYCKRGRGLIKINGCPIELMEPEILHRATAIPRRTIATSVFRLLRSLILFTASIVEPDFAMIYALVQAR